MGQSLSTMVVGDGSKVQRKEGDKELATVNEGIAQIEWQPPTTFLDFMLTTLPNFMKLPIETRYKIWKLTLLPRVVEVHWALYDEDGNQCDINDLRGDTYYENAAEDMPENLGFWSQTSLPVALAVCRDLRKAVLPYYPLCFAATSEPARIRFNFDIDTLSVHGKSTPFTHRLSDLMSPKEQLQIKYLIVLEGNLIGGEEYWDTIEDTQKNITKLVSLEEVTIGMDAIRSRYEHLLYLDRSNARDYRLDDLDTMLDETFSHEYPSKLTVGFPSDLIADFALQEDEILGHYMLEDGNWRLCKLAHTAKYLWYTHGNPYKQFCS